MGNVIEKLNIGIVGAVGRGGGLRVGLEAWGFVLKRQGRAARIAALKMPWQAMALSLKANDP